MCESVLNESCPHGGSSLQYNKKRFCFLRLKRAGNVLRFHNEEIRAHSDQIRAARAHHPTDPTYHWKKTNQKA